MTVPLQGTLDLLANRNLASGVHAWTDTDHTRFTLSNAGSQGFLNILPIFLDHILYPTLTVSGRVQHAVVMWIRDVIMVLSLH